MLSWSRFQHELIPVQNADAVKINAVRSFTYKLVRADSPRRPPRLSHSSWTLIVACGSKWVTAAFYSAFWVSTQVVSYRAFWDADKPHTVSSYLDKKWLSLWNITRTKISCHIVPRPRSDRPSFSWSLNPGKDGQWENLVSVSAGTTAHTETDSTNFFPRCQRMTFSPPVQIQMISRQSCVDDITSDVAPGAEDYSK